MNAPPYRPVKASWLVLPVLAALVVLDLFAGRVL